MKGEMTFILRSNKSNVTGDAYQDDVTQVGSGWKHVKASQCCILIVRRRPPCCLKCLITAPARQAGSEEDGECDSSKESMELFCVHAREKLTNSIRLQWRKLKDHVERLDSQGRRDGAKPCYLVTSSQSITGNSKHGVPWHPLFFFSVFKQHWCCVPGDPWGRGWQAEAWDPAVQGPDSNTAAAPSRKGKS